MEPEDIDAGAGLTAKSQVFKHWLRVWMRALLLLSCRAEQVGGCYQGARL